MTLIIPAPIQEARNLIVERIAERLTDENARADFEREMNLSDRERFAYQTLQSECFALGLITQDVAQYIYAGLGEVGSDANGNWPSDVPLADKVVITTLMGELYNKRFAAIGR